MSTHDEFPFAGPKKEEKKWDSIPTTKKDWFATVFIFLLPPLGLYFLWRGKTYWLRNGKPTVVSGIRKFILSIPAVLIMLIVATFALDLPSTEMDGGPAVATAGTGDNGLSEKEQAAINAWGEACIGARDNYADYLNTGDVSYLMLGDRSLATCDSYTDQARVIIRQNHLGCAALMSNINDQMHSYRTAAVQARAYAEQGMRGMAKDIFDKEDAKLFEWRRRMNFSCYGHSDE